MDKKNTLLLTVIAVATLLVAVVGATFAYFSIGATGTSNTNIRVGAQSVGTFSLSTGGEQPHLTLNATDMTKAVAGASGKTYYSTITASKGFEGNATPHNFAKVTVTGGDASVNHKCTATITVTLTNTKKVTFNEGEGKLHLSGDAGVDLTKLTWLEDGVVDFANLGTAQTGTVTFTIAGAGAGKTADKFIKGYLEFTNTTSDQTSRLNGFEVTAQINVGSFTCNVA